MDRKQADHVARPQNMGEMLVGFRADERARGIRVHASDRVRPLEERAER